jgi:hypothetical protein
LQWYVWEVSRERDKLHRMHCTVPIFQ